MADNIRVNKAVISTIEYYLGLIKSDWTASKMKLVMAFDLAAMKKNYETGDGDTLNIDTAALPIFDVSNPVCPDCGTDDIIYRFKTNTFICHKCVDVEWANGC